MVTAAGGRRGGTATQRLAACEPKQRSIEASTGGRQIDLIDGQTIVWSYEKKVLRFLFFWESVPGF
jgi:hypothetical protein